MPGKQKLGYTQGWEKTVPDNKKHVQQKKTIFSKGQFLQGAFDARFKRTFKKNFFNGVFLLSQITKGL